MTERITIVKETMMFHHKILSFAIIGKQNTILKFSNRKGGLWISPTFTCRASLCILHIRHEYGNCMSEACAPLINHCAFNFLLRRSSNPPLAYNRNVRVWSKTVYLISNVDLHRQIPRFACSSDPNVARPEQSLVQSLILPSPDTL